MVAASCIRHIFLLKTNNCFGNCSEWPVRRHFPPELSRLRDVDVECNWFAPFIQSCYHKVHIRRLHWSNLVVVCLYFLGGEGGVTILSRSLLAWSAEPRGDRDNRKDKQKKSSKKSLSCEWPWSTHRSKPFRHGQQTGNGNTLLGREQYFSEGIIIVFEIVDHKIWMKIGIIM